MYDELQLDLFHGHTINPTLEIKRQIRLVVSASNMSRDQIVDEMNRLASSIGIKGNLTKDKFDGWCKDSDLSRLPSPVWLVVFCRVMNTVAPLAAMAAPLGCRVIGPDKAKILALGEAEIEKKKAAKRSRLAWEMVE
jgi:hypothetical protein